MIISALGWIAAIAFLAASASSCWHGWRDKARGPWIGAGLYACAAFCLLAIDGALRPLTAGVLAFLALAAAGTVAVVDGRSAGPDGGWKAVAGSARGGAGAGFGHLGRDTRGIWRHLAARLRGSEDEEGTGQAAVAAVAEAAGTRIIPPVRDDPALGLPPEPAVISSVQAPAPFLALAQFIAGSEPEDDQALTMFMQGCASGGMLVADAWRHFADVCLGSVGLDPAYVAGILEVGDTEGESAQHKAQVHKRFGVIYGAVQEWIAGGRMLPHKAREFLTGEGA